jgi:hypothetical protein
MSDQKLVANSGDHRQKTIRLYGAIETFTAPGILTGWVRNSENIGNGLDITISIYKDDKLIGEGRPTRSRHDIVNNPVYLTGFGITCSEDITDEMIAFEQLRIEAHDRDGRTSRLPIWDRVRAIAFDNLMTATVPLGKSSISAILKTLGQNKKIDEDARKAIQDVYELYFEGNNLEILFGFESLGRDCSLGAVQRFYGAEPLGLFRFSGIKIDSMLAAFKSQFKGIGSPEFTRLDLHTGREYYSRDIRYDMWSHTYVFENDVEFDRLYKQQCKKLTFLVRNIVEKLRDGEKIFVIHAIPEQISDDKLLDLLGEIRKFGRSPLLYLQPPTDLYPSGTVIVRDDGIISGYVPHIPLDVSPTAVACEQWLSVLKAAHLTIFNHLKKRGV